MTRHKFERYEWKDGEVRILCSCGFRTGSYSRAGLAGAEHDRHAEEATKR